jgi:hypothetical protein
VGEWGILFLCNAASIYHWSDSHQILGWKMGLEFLKVDGGLRFWLTRIVFELCKLLSLAVRKI